MGPREGDANTCTGEGLVITSAFWNRLHTLPVIQSTIQTTLDIYTTSRERPFLGKGLGVLEYGVNLASTPMKKVACTIADKYPAATTTAQKLDNLAVNCLDTLENKIQAIRKSPGQIVTNVKTGASTAIHSGVRRVMKTYPGQQVVKCLDSMITWSETTICGNSENAGEIDEGKKSGVIALKLRSGAVVPLKIYLRMLKMVKHMLAFMAGVNTRVPAASPCKGSLQSRRLVAPRKRLPGKSFLSNLANYTLCMLGLKKRTDEEVAQGLRRAGSESPEGHPCRHEKRKHEDEDDSESDAESLDLASALDHYDSEFDSDYCPGDDPNDDSLEYSSGDMESDLDTEEPGVIQEGLPRQLQGELINPHKENPPTAPTEDSH